MEFLEINITRAYNDKETDPSLALPKSQGRVTYIFASKSWESDFSEKVQTPPLATTSEQLLNCSQKSYTNYTTISNVSILISVTIT